jgi:peptidoglycan/xylan/chitin deacetylase (PgdA/CDA1 family)
MSAAAPIAAWTSAAVLAPLGLLAYGALSPNARLFGPVVSRGPANVRAVYLTFDDGPSPTATERIVDTLGELAVPAAFFLLGRHVRLHPALARRVGESPHLIGNHTETHGKLHLAGPARVERELALAHAVIEGEAGRAPVAFRAPHGYRSPFVRDAAARRGYTVFGWTLGVWDSARPGVEEIRRRVRAGLRPGTVLLLHDGDGADPKGDRAQTAAAVPGIVRDVTDAGYALRPLAELVP